MSNVHKWTIRILIASLSITSVTAQVVTPSTPDEVSRHGLMPGYGYTISDFETIDNVFGNVGFQLPLASMPPGRAGHSASLLLHYGSQIYETQQTFRTLTTSQGPQTLPATVLVNGILAGSGSGWDYGYDFKIIEETRELDPNNNTCNPNNGADPATYRFRRSLELPDGSRHLLRLYGQTDAAVDGYYRYQYTGVAACPSNPTSLSLPITYFTSDGTFIKVVQTSTTAWTAYLPDGKKVDRAAGITKIYDRNGNWIQITRTTTPTEVIQLTDIWNRAITVNRPNGSSDTVTFKGFGSVDLTWTITWTSFTVPAIVYPCATDPGTHAAVFCSLTPTHVMVNSVQMPNGRQFQFGYDATHYGEVNLVKLPGYDATTDSGRVNYTWKNNGKLTGNLTVNTLATKKVTYNEVQDGTTTTPPPDTWTYSFGVETASNQTTIAAPDNGTITHYFYNTPGGGLYGKVFKTTLPGGDMVERIWNSNKPYFVGTNGTIYQPLANQYIKNEFRSIANAAGTPVRTAATSFSYDKNGNLSQTLEYDWINPSAISHDASGAPNGFTPGSTLRTTANTYNVLTATAGDGAENVPDETGAYWNPSSGQFRTLLKSSSVTGVGPGSLAYFLYDTRGNQTQEARWDSIKVPTRPPATSLDSTNSSVVTRVFDSIFGNLTQVTDARENESAGTGSVDVYAYDTYGRCLTQITTASNVAAQRRITTHDCDPSTGLGILVGDVDNGTQQTLHYDPYGRLNGVQDEYPANTALRQSSTLYDDANRTIKVASDLVSLNDGSLVSITRYDNIGRIDLTTKLEDASNSIKIQRRYKYNGANRYELVSNPYRAATSGGAGTENTMGWTRTMFDQRDRVKEVESFSGTALPAPWGSNPSSTGKVMTSYDADAFGRKTVVTDQAGNSRVNTWDALGRLATVVENGVNYTTSYGYDALDNLTSVTQGALARTFAYDSLKRLTSATNPETGTINYTYYASGNLYTRKDPRIVSGTTQYTTTFVYDNQSRLTSKSYNDGVTPAATYSYGNSGCAPAFCRGKLLTVQSSAATRNQTVFDALGRVTGSNQVNAGQPYNFVYTYNLADRLKSLTYPSLRVASFTYDAAGRPLGATGVWGSVNTTYASGATYTPADGLQQMTVGSLVEARGYNSRLQPTSVTATAATQLLSLTFTYPTTSNNGNMSSQIIGPLGVTQNYNNYDGANRLTSASEGSNWSQTYVYDAFGNRAVLGSSYLLSSSYTPQVPLTTSPLPYANNKWNGATYDPAGNLTAVGAYTFAYDGESRQTQAVQMVGGSPVTTNYTYDGDGRRITKAMGGVTTVYAYDAMGNLAAEYSSQTTPPAPLCTTCYLTADHLGSVRLVTDGAGVVKSRHDYLPFGEEIPASVGRTSVAGYGAADLLAQRFTGKERDAETALDYFGARYMSGAQGRFTSVDPIWITKERMLDPQRLNLYAYGRNNPLRYIDPDGMDVTLGKCALGSKQECFERVQQGLRQEDREHVHLVEGNGKNGFKKGEDGVSVDAAYKSDSKNFQALQTLAGDHSATATIDVLNPNEKFDVRVIVSVNRVTGAEQTATMGTTPSEAGGFTGYTFYPQGQGVPGPWTTGDFTEVVINAGRGWIPSSIHHELRHVLLGDFGRVAPYGAHDKGGRVDQETTEAEKEAVKNQLQGIGNQR